MCQLSAHVFALWYGKPSTDLWTQTREEGEWMDNSKDAFKGFLSTGRSLLCATVMDDIGLFHSNPYPSIPLIDNPWSMGQYGRGRANTGQRRGSHSGIGNKQDGERIKSWGREKSMLADDYRAVQSGGIRKLFITTDTRKPINQTLYFLINDHISIMIPPVSISTIASMDEFKIDISIALLLLQFLFHLFELLRSFI